MFCLCLLGMTFASSPYMFDWLLRPCKKLSIGMWPHGHHLFIFKVFESSKVGNSKCMLYIGRKHSFSSFSPIILAKEHNSAAKGNQCQGLLVCKANQWLIFYCFNFPLFFQHQILCTCQTQLSDALIIQDLIHYFDCERLWSLLRGWPGHVEEKDFQGHHAMASLYNLLKVCTKNYTSMYLRWADVF